jgi:hypothetical protein
MMNDTEQAVAQLIVDHQIMSAYRNMAIKAQLRSLCEPLGILSNVEALNSSSLVDPFMMQALMSSMASQDQLTSQIDLLNALRPTRHLVSPTTQNVVVSDALRALGKNGSSNFSSLSNIHSSTLSQASLLQNQQNLLSALAPSNGGLLSRAQNKFKQKNSLASTVNAFEEARALTTTMELLNRLSAATSSIPASSCLTMKASELIGKRQWEEHVSTQSNTKKPRIESPLTHGATVKHSKSIVTDSNCRPLQASKAGGSKKEKSKTKKGTDEAQITSTYEDAQLLFDTLVTLSSSCKKKAKKSSVVSIASQHSMTKFGDPVSPSELTSLEMSGTVPDFLFIAMAQMSLAAMKPTIKGTDITTKHGELGHAAMCCKHCKSVIGFGGNFFQRLRQGFHIHRIVKHVHNECPSCPDNIREAIQKNCTSIDSSSLGLRLSNSVESNKAFLEHIWNQLSVLGFVDKTVDDKNDINSAGESHNIGKQDHSDLTNS